MAITTIDNQVIAKLNSTYPSEQQDTVFIIKHAILMSQGIWNDVYYGKDEIRKACNSTDWTDKNNTNLWLDHKDLSASEWIGHVKNPSFEGDTLYGDLYVYDPIWIPKLKYGKPKFGISPKVMGAYDEGKKIMNNFTYQNFSVVVNPAVKRAYLNNMEVLQMSEITVDDLLKAEAEKSKAVEAKTSLSDEEVLAKAKEILKAREQSKPQNMENMEDVFDLFELYTAKNLSVASITTKARQIRENNESWKSAVKRAAKLEESEMDKIAEEAKKEPEVVEQKVESEEISVLKQKLQVKK